MRLVVASIVHLLLLATHFNAAEDQIPYLCLKFNISCPTTTSPKPKFSTFIVNLTSPTSAAPTISTTYTTIPTMTTSSSKISPTISTVTSTRATTTAIPTTEKTTSLSPTSSTSTLTKTTPTLSTTMILPSTFPPNIISESSIPPTSSTTITSTPSPTQKIITTSMSTSLIPSSEKTTKAFGTSAPSTNTKTFASTSASSSTIQTTEAADSSSTSTSTKASTSTAASSSSVKTTEKTNTSSPFTTTNISTSSTALSSSFKTNELNETSAHSKTTKTSKTSTTPVTVSISTRTSSSTKRSSTSSKPSSTTTTSTTLSETTTTTKTALPTSTSAKKKEEAPTEAGPTIDTKGTTSQMIKASTSTSSSSSASTSSPTKTFSTEKPTSPKKSTVTPSTKFSTTSLSVETSIPTTETSAHSVTSSSTAKITEVSIESTAEKPTTNVKTSTNFQKSSTPTTLKKVEMTDTEKMATLTFSTASEKVQPTSTIEATIDTSSKASKNFGMTSPAESTQPTYLETSEIGKESSSVSTEEITVSTTSENVETTSSTEATKPTPSTSSEKMETTSLTEATMATLSTESIEDETKTSSETSTRNKSTKKTATTPKKVTQTEKSTNNASSSTTQKKSETTIKKPATPPIKKISTRSTISENETTTATKTTTPSTTPEKVATTSEKKISTTPKKSSMPSKTSKNIVTTTEKKISTSTKNRSEPSTASKEAVTTSEKKISTTTKKSSKPSTTSKKVVTTATSRSTASSATSMKVPLSEKPTTSPTKPVTSTSATSTRTVSTTAKTTKTTADDVKASSTIASSTTTEKTTTRQLESTRSWATACPEGATEGPLFCYMTVPDGRSNSSYLKVKSACNRIFGSDSSIISLYELMDPVTLKLFKNMTGEKNTTVFWAEGAGSRTQWNRLALRINSDAAPEFFQGEGIDKVPIYNEDNTVGGICKVPKYGAAMECATDTFHEALYLRGKFNLPQAGKFVAVGNRITSNCSLPNCYEPNWTFLCNPKGVWSPHPDAVNCTQRRGTLWVDTARPFYGREQEKCQNCFCLFGPFFVGFLWAGTVVFVVAGSLGQAASTWSCIGYNTDTIVPNLYLLPLFVFPAFGYRKWAEGSTAVRYEYRRRLRAWFTVFSPRNVDFYSRVLRNGPMLDLLPFAYALQYIAMVYHVAEPENDQYRTLSAVAIAINTVLHWIQFAVTAPPLWNFVCNKMMVNLPSHVAPKFNTVMRWTRDEVLCWKAPLKYATEFEEKLELENERRKMEVERAIQKRNKMLERCPTIDLRLLPAVPVFLEAEAPAEHLAKLTPNGIEGPEDYLSDFSLEVIRTRFFVNYIKERLDSRCERTHCAFRVVAREWVQVGYDQSQIAYHQLIRLFKQCCDIVRDNDHLLFEGEKPGMDPLKMNRPLAKCFEITQRFRRRKNAPPANTTEAVKKYERMLESIGYRYPVDDFKSVFYSDVAEDYETFIAGTHFVSRMPYIHTIKELEKRLEIFAEQAKEENAIWDHIYDDDDWFVERSEEEKEALRKEYKIVDSQQFPNPRKMKLKHLHDRYFDQIRPGFIGPKTPNASIYPDFGGLFSSDKFWLEEADEKAFYSFIEMKEWRKSDKELYEKYRKDLLKPKEKKHKPPLRDVGEETGLRQRFKNHLRE